MMGPKSGRRGEARGEAAERGRQERGGEASSLSMPGESQKEKARKVVVEVECSKRRTSAQVKVEGWEGPERGTITRGGGGREAGGGGAAASETAAAAHLWALSLIRCLTAAGSALISAVRTALASRWPRVMGLAV